MFEWDEAKAARNCAKHGIDFEDAARALLGLCFTSASPKSGEVRLTTTGEVEGRVIVIVWTPRDGAMRLISARPANRNERRTYHQEIASRARGNTD